MDRQRNGYNLSRCHICQGCEGLGEIINLKGFGKNDDRVTERKTGEAGYSHRHFKYGETVEFLLIVKD